jgi:4-amino-4-deoxy-L-arabinose transferase
MSSSISRALFVGVLAAAVTLLFVGAGGVPLFDPDESRFARTSVEMLGSGDLVVPRFGGEPRLVKPPLIHWLQCFSFGLFGVTEWAARLHAGLATLGSVALTGFIARRRFGDEGAVWAAAVLATTPLVLVLGRTGTLDALLAVHVLAAIALDLAAPTTESAARYRAPVLGGLLGLAFLAKGPVGIALPLVVMLAGRTATGRDVLPSFTAFARGLAAWCVVVLPWGLAFLRRIGAAGTLELLRGEVLDRYFVGTTHVEPFWFYGKALAAGFLPWLAPLAVALVRAWRSRRDPIARTARYAAAGLCAGVVFLSFGRGKEASYLLPLAPLAAILVTWELAREVEAPRERSLGPVLLAGVAAATAVLCAMAAFFQFEGASRQVALAGAVLFGAAAIPACAGALRHAPRWVYGSVAAATAATFLVAVLVLFPALGERRSAAPLIAAVPELSSGRPLVTVEVRVPSLTFYLGRMPETIEMHDLVERMGRGDDPLFILADVDLEALPEPVRTRLAEVGRRGKLIVLEIAS